MLPTNKANEVPSATVRLLIVSTGSPLPLPNQIGRSRSVEMNNPRLIPTDRNKISMSLTRLKRNTFVTYPGTNMKNKSSSDWMDPIRPALSRTTEVDRANNITNDKNLQCSIFIFPKFPVTIKSGSSSANTPHHNLTQEPMV